MRVGHCLLSIFHLLGAILALTIPDTATLISSNSTRLSSVGQPYRLRAPAPAAPYTTIQDQALLTFHDYGAPLLPSPARRLVLRALSRITNDHGVDSTEEIGREVGYTLKSYTGGGSLRFWVKPEASMTWGMFATVTIGVTRFLERWDNVELAVDIAIGTDGGGKVGTAYLSRV